MSKYDDEHVRAQVILPCIGTPDFLRISITDQFAKNSRQTIWEKFCPSCKKFIPILDFIKFGRFEKLGPPHLKRKFKELYYVLYDDSICNFCAPPTELLCVHKDSTNKLRMRLRLHYANGQEYEIYDEKERKMVPISCRGLRLMKGEINHIRFQPYDDRGKNKKGESYRDLKQEDLQL